MHNEVPNKLVPREVGAAQAIRETEKTPVDRIIPYRRKHRGYSVIISA
jgi:hypothetical protein